VAPKGAGSSKITTLAKRRYGPKSSRALTLQMIPGSGRAELGDTDFPHAEPSSPSYQQLTKPLVPLLEDIATVSLIGDEELSSARISRSSAVSGTVGELESRSSGNKQDADLDEIEDSAIGSLAAAAEEDKKRQERRERIGLSRYLNSNHFLSCSSNYSHTYYH
jgi:hypothetical protein